MTGEQDATHIDDELADIAEAVMRLGREIEHRHSHPDHIPLTVNERLVLRELDIGGEHTPSVLASVLGLQRSNLSTALRSLESKSLITRTQGAGDGRGVVVRSTELAHENLQRMRARWTAVLTPVVPEDTDVAALRAVLKDVADTLVAQRGRDTGTA